MTLNEIVDITKLCFKEFDIKYSLKPYLHVEKIFEVKNKNFHVKILVQKSTTKIELFNVKTKSFLTVFYTYNKFIDTTNYSFYLVNLIKFIG